MNHDKIFRLKKYLFFISMFVFAPLFIHLVYTYLYSDSKVNVIEGGTISEAIIGNVPTLNPLKSLSGDNKYVINLLYRSLLRYDVSEKKIVSDIASCDLNDLLSIKCYLKDNVVWSNGEKITVNDIISTYKIYKNTDINPIMSTLLSNTDITEENNSIIFSSSEAHIKFLDIFFSPIVPESLTNQISLDDSKTNFFSSGGIYSGKYTFESLLKDDEDGVTKLNLIKNKNYTGNSVNIERLVLNFFPSSSEFLKHKDGINFFNDDNNILGNSIPRLQNNSFYLPQYISLFINKDNITDESLRNYIFNKINRENLLKILGEENFRELKNPYLTDINIDKEINDKNINKILSNLGYYRKSDLLGKIISTNKSYSTGSQLLTGSILTETSKVIENQVYTIDKFQKKSNVIIDPNFIEKYNFITKDNILLKGVAGNNVSEVYVNDYKLNGFSSGNDVFYYRIREGVGNIKEGINKYKIEFTRNGKKDLVDEIYFVYYKSKTELDKQKDIFIKNLYGINEKKPLEVPSEKQVIKVQDQKLTNENEQKINKINSLEDKYFYNDKLEKLTFNLTYISSSKDMELTSNYIKTSLDQEGITVNINPITIDQLADIISKDDIVNNKINNYDMILVPINLGNFDFDIFSYFHSSKVNHKPKSNFAKIKKSDLDSLLEELEGKYLPKDQIIEIEKKVLEILKKEQVVKVLYTPLINNLVDKNIKNYEKINYIPDKTFRNQLVDNVYIIEKKILNLNDKGFIGFIKFLLKSLNE